MGETLAVRARQHYRVRRPALAPDVVDRGKKRLGLHHHPRPAAKRHVVDDAVPVSREISQVVNRDVDHASSDCPPDHALRKRRLDHRRKDADDVDLHFLIGGDPCTPPSSLHSAGHKRPLRSVRTSCSSRTLGGLTAAAHIHSPFVRFDQTWWRIDHDHSRRRVDRDANVFDERYQHFTAGSGNHQVTTVDRSVHGGHQSHYPTARLPDFAADEIVPVVRPGGQRRNLAPPASTDRPRRAPRRRSWSRPLRAPRPAVPGETAPR